MTLPNTVAHGALDVETQNTKRRRILVKDIKLSQNGCEQCHGQTWLNMTTGAVECRGRPDLDDLPPCGELYPSAANRHMPTKGKPMVMSHAQFMKHRADNPPEFEGVALMLGPDTSPVGPGGKNRAIGIYKERRKVHVRRDISGHHPKQIRKRLNHVRFSDDPVQSFDQVLVVTHSLVVLDAWTERQYDEDGEPYDVETDMYDRVLVSDGYGIVLRLSELHTYEWLMNFSLGTLYCRGEFGWADRYSADDTEYARELLAGRPPDPEYPPL